jgi:hypothetical protein
MSDVQQDAAVQQTLVAQDDYLFMLIATVIPTFIRSMIRRFHGGSYVGFYQRIVFGESQPTIRRNTPRPFYVSKKKPSR